MQRDTEPPQILILDLDDTVARRHPLVRVGGLVSRLVVGEKRTSGSENESLPYGLDESMNHEMVPGGYKNPLDWWSNLMHSGRSAFPEVVSEIEANFNQGNEIVIATGRSSRERWIRTTQDFLILEGLDQLVSHVYFTPKGVSTLESKADVVALKLEEYPNSQIRFRDDDPKTIGEIARRFSTVQVEYMFHPITAGLVRSNFTTDNIKMVTRSMIADRYAAKSFIE